MNEYQILIEKNHTSGKIRIGVAGELLASRPFFTIHISHIGELRENVFWATALNPDQVGGFLPNEIEGIKDNEIYCVYVSSEESYQFGTSSPNFDALILKKYFKISEENVVLLSKSEGEAEYDKQRAKNISPLYAEDGHAKNATAFEIVIFFAGINIFHASAMKGISLYPILPGLSNISTHEAVFEYLQIRHNAIIPRGIELPKEKLFYLPMFAIDFHQIFAGSETSAFNFATTTAQDFSNIIASESGDKPYPVFYFILEHASGNWKASATNVDFRGNLLPPLFPSSNPERIEKIHPILQSNPYARLVLELYVQSLAERDKSFRFFRQWALLEMIADNEIKRSPATLLNLDGTNIHLESGDPLTTERKEGKVYAYLRIGSLPATYQGMLNGQTRVLEGALNGIDQGGGVITLWQAVAASYKIRNDVAHDGHFNPNKKSKNDRDSLCKEFFAGQFDFLGNALYHSVWREIFKTKK